MTRFEQIAAAFPLHAQRIAECVFESEGPEGLESFLRQTTVSRLKASPMALAFLFDWEDTQEGYTYWDALYTGDGVA